MKTLRVLIIDDNESIHHDFDKILSVDQPTPLDDMEAVLFAHEGTVAGEKKDDVIVHHAFQGDEAVEMIETASRRGLPYDVAFVDVRMPPGIDGVQTISMARLTSPDTRFILCTAYSDYTQEQAQEKIGISGGLLFVAKPFEPETIRKLVIKSH